MSTNKVKTLLDRIAFYDTCIDMESRKYKFRGWSPANGWVYGSYIEKSARYGTFYYIYVRADDEEEVDQEIQVDWKSICQYTGINDVTGKEIYEGDIIEMTFDRNHESVGYIYHDYGSFLIKTLDGKGTFQDSYYSMKSGKVVSNLFEDDMVKQKLLNKHKRNEKKENSKRSR